MQPWLAAEFLPAVWYGQHACALRTHHPPAPFTLTRHEGGSTSKEAASTTIMSKLKTVFCSILEWSNTARKLKKKTLQGLRNCSSGQRRALSKERRLSALSVLSALFELFLLP